MRNAKEPEVEILTVVFRLCKQRQPLILLQKSKYCGEHSANSPRQE